MSHLLIQATATAIPLRDESVQCVVTSPPYWGLRAYAGEQQLVWGGEPEHEHEWSSHVAKASHYTGKKKWQHISAAAQAAGEKVRDHIPEAWGHPEVEQGASCPCGAWHGALGLEPTPELYVEHVVEVFREVWRVLRPDGTLWLNLGDSYAASRSGPAGDTSTLNGSRHAPEESRHAKDAAGRPNSRWHFEPWGLKPKDLVGIPWEVARALRRDGWWVRSDIVWNKSNPMPESIRDRPTKSHEYVFLLTKSGATTFWVHRDGHGARQQPRPDYRWVHAESGAEFAEPPIKDWQAKRIPCPDCGASGIVEEIAVTIFGEEITARRCDRCDDKHGNTVRLYERINLWSGSDYFYDQDAIREQGTSGPSDLKKMTEGKERLGGKTLTDDEPLHKANRHTNIGQKRAVGSPMRNARSVWNIATAPYAGAHFATFPEKLAERCVLAGSSRQACGECGAPWAREVEREYRSDIITTGTEEGRHTEGRNRNVTRMGDGVDVTTTGWQPTCEHDDGSGRSVVLDPFAGTSTVGRAALRLGRDYVGLDISREYLAEHSVDRLRGVVTAVQEEML